MKLYLVIICIITGMVFQEVESSTFQDNVVLKNIFTDTSVDTTQYTRMLNKSTVYTQNVKNFLVEYYLFMRDPGKERIKYINAFPEDYDSIMHLVYEKIELERFSPSFLFSFKVIGDAAISGDCNAARKVVRVYVNSDGVVADLMFGYLVTLFKTNLDLILNTICELNERDTKKICLSLKYLNVEDKDIIRKNVLKHTESWCHNLDALMGSL